ncbi:MAG: DNA translocase FtsK, partial [Chlamydiia bacterium]|nr:DNA translocase FtsK [Chlamydiia bacterium]
QRPSREVITGIIKANFPTRIAFKVSSRVNSQIILDEVGAEGLLGNGDMLYLPPGTSQLIRAQGAFIRDEEIHSIVDHVRRQSPPRYVIPSFDDPDIGAEFLTGGAEERERDTLYDRALEVVQSTGQASTTFLQRKLKIGYARAASLIDQLEEEGVIGPVEEGVKGRRLLSLKSSGSDDFISEE